MSDRIFLDTNILVYLFDNDAPEKQSRARDILSSRDLKPRIIISTQVLQEFYVAVTRKLAEPLETDVAAQAVRNLATLPVVQVDSSMILLAILRSRTDQLSFWDSLIIQSALAGGARQLYTEDLQHGRVIESMRIENPFLVEKE